MIAAQEVGFTTQYGTAFWIVTVGLIAALVLILRMAKEMRELRAKNRTHVYNEKLYDADHPPTEDVFVMDYHGRNDPVDEVGVRNEIEKFFEDKPGEDPMAKRNT